jgi:hypothetical protein
VTFLDDVDWRVVVEVGTAVGFCSVGRFSKNRSNETLLIDYFD